MSTLNVLDLFCGAGGLSYGFECAGFDILLGIDNDAKALETFELNHKGSKSICGDITQITYEDHIKPLLDGKQIDVIIGGPPCQGMSLSGPRKFDDPRNKLYLSYIRLVKEIQPKAFVIENVPGLVGLFGGQIKDSIIEKFTEMGYHIEYQILCSADYGVPQSRKRVVFVGTKVGSFEYPAINPNVVTCSMALSDLPALEDELGEEVSEYANVQWSIQHQMEAGKYKLRTAPFGYTIQNGMLMVNEAEAPIVQGIFNDYLSGANTKEICEWLNAQQGSSRKWLRREIDYILMNERYAGNAIFQKKYTTAEMPRTVKRNHGERAMYYVSDSNVPIIPQDVFDCAQELRKRRTVSRSEKPKVYSGKIQCSCGSRCRAKTSNQIWYWSCVVHEEQRNACPVKQVPEETINAAFCRLYYKLKHHGDPIFAQMLSNLQKVRYSRMLWSEDVISLNKKISDTLSQAQFLAQLQQAGGVDPDTFISSNNKLSEQLRRLKQEKARLLDTDSDDLADRTRDLMDALEDGPDFLDSFDAELFDALVERIIVDSNERLRFKLKNGLELTEQIERTRR